MKITFKQVYQFANLPLNCFLDSVSNELSFMLPNKYMNDF